MRVLTGAPALAASQSITDLFIACEVRRGERSAAIAYTLIETAKLNGVDPQAWLTDVLSRIGDHSFSRNDRLFMLRVELRRPRPSGVM